MSSTLIICLTAAALFALAVIWLWRHRADVGRRLAGRASRSQTLVDRLAGDDTLAILEDNPELVERVLARSGPQAREAVQRFQALPADQRARLLQEGLASAQASGGLADPHATLRTLGDDVPAER